MRFSAISHAFPLTDMRVWPKEKQKCLRILSSSVPLIRESHQSLPYTSLPIRVPLKSVGPGKIVQCAGLHFPSFHSSIAPFNHQEQMKVLCTSQESWWTQDYGVSMCHLLLHTPEVAGISFSSRNVAVGVYVLGIVWGQKPE